MIMMKINCLSCGFKVDIDDDTYSDYDGDIKCYVCGATLRILTEDGKLKSSKILNAGSSVGRA